MFIYIKYLPKIDVIPYCVCSWVYSSCTSPINHSKMTVKLKNNVFYITHNLIVIPHFFCHEYSYCTNNYNVFQYTIKTITIYKWLPFEGRSPTSMVINKICTYLWDNRQTRLWNCFSSAYNWINHHNVIHYGLLKLCTKNVAKGKLFLKNFCGIYYPRCLRCCNMAFLRHAISS